MRRVRIDPRFEELYRAEYASVFRAAYVVCADRAIAQDAVQEAFARALERWGRLGDQPWAGGWVTTTAMNVARRGLRRRGGKRAVDEAGDPDGNGPDRETAMDVRRALRALPPRQQEAAVLHYPPQPDSAPVPPTMEPVGNEVGTSREA